MRPAVIICCKNPFYKATKINVATLLIKQLLTIELPIKMPSSLSCDERPVSCDIDSMLFLNEVFHNAS